MHDSEQSSGCHPTKHRKCPRPRYNKCKPEVIPVGGDARLVYGFAPFWDKKTQSWYFVDFASETNKSFCRFDYAEQKLYQASVPNENLAPTSFIPMKQDNYFLAGLAFQKRIVKMYWDGRSEYITVDGNKTIVEPETSSTLLDLSTVDPFGRFVAALYRFTGCRDDGNVTTNVYLYRKNGQAVRIISDIQTSGGLCFNKERRLMYFFDSCDYNILEYQWDPKTGTLCKKSNDCTVFFYRQNE